MSENYELDLGRPNGRERHESEPSGTEGGYRNGSNHAGNGGGNSFGGWTRGHRPEWEEGRARWREQAQLPYSETILKDPEYKLPFDPWRLFEALKQRWLWLTIGAAGAGCAALLVALWL